MNRTHLFQWVRAGIVASAASLLVAGCGGGGGGGGNNSSGTTPTSVVDLTPRFAYVINQSVIGGYVVDPESGNLIPRGNSQRFFESTPTDIAAKPDGRFIYFSDEGGANLPAIRRYDIDSQTGVHAYASGAEYLTGSPGPTQMVMHPSGQYLYYRKNGNQPITALALAPDTGDISLIGDTAPLVAGGILVSPDGKFLYATRNIGDKQVWVFRIAADGSLSLVDADPLTSGDQPQLIANAGSNIRMHPANGDIYAIDTSSVNGSIRRYVADAATGFLTLVDSTPILDAIVFSGTLDGMYVEPRGRFGYIRMSSNLIAGFSIDLVDGTLAQIDYDPVTAGVQQLDFGALANSINSIDLEPSGRFVYFGLNNASVATIEKYAIDQASGVLSQSASKPELNKILALPRVGRIVFTNRTNVPLPGPTYAYSRQNAQIGIHRVDAATGLLTDVGTFAIPAYSHLQVDPAQKFMYVGENAVRKYTRVRIDGDTGALSGREVRVAANAVPDNLQGVRFDPHNRFAVQTKALADGMDFMEVVTGPPGGLGTAYSDLQFTKNPHTFTNPGGASAVRPNSRQMYSTGLVSGTVASNVVWVLRLFNLDVTPVGFNWVDAQPATAGHQDFPISIRAVDTVVEPLGRYLLNLETNSLLGGATNTDNLAVYELDWVTGQPTLRFAITIPFVNPNHTTGSNPLHIALDPRGRFVYVPTVDGIAGFAFTRNTSGPALQTIDIDPATPGFNLLQPVGGRQRLAIDPTGQWLYSGTEGFKIDQTTGALESLGVVSSAPIVQVIGRL